MPWKPSQPGEIPTLGYEAIDWLFENLNSPDDPDGSPLVMTREQEDFILNWYQINPANGRFIKERGLIGRARGWGKSPFLGALAIFEALGPCRFAGWNAAGQPVGQEWLNTRVPLVAVAAVSEAQTNNTWLSMLSMLEGPVAENYPGLEPMQGHINLPVGKIERITSNARTVKGARSVFAILDQTEEWVASNNGLKLAQTLRTNAAKVGGRTLESPNAYIPGEGSVAEESANYAKGIAEGKYRDDSLLWDHREAAPNTVLTDRESLIAGLRWAYGDSSDHPDGCVIHQPPCEPGWAPIESNARMFWDPANDVQQLRSDFLNQITHASDAWVTRPEWNARALDIVNDGVKAAEQIPEPAAGDVITLGFDGSRKRERGGTDATALVACRLSDGLIWPVQIWEEPTDEALAKDWQIPADEVDRVVDETFAKYQVVGFYADPPKWESWVAKWESKYGRKLAAGSRTHPIEWWMSGGGNRVKVTRALEQFRDALIDGEITHTANTALTRHVLNARRRSNTSGYGIYKDTPDSIHKIDGAVAAVLAYQARLDAIAAGASGTRIPMAIPIRVR